MKTRRWTTIVAGLALTLAIARCEVSRAQAQVPATKPGVLTAREAIEAEFRRDMAKIEKARIGRLAALAAGEPRAEAAKTYEELFRFAIAVELYDDAEPFAERVIQAGDAPAEVVLLAEMVNLVAEANRGEYDKSLASLSAAIQIREAAAKNDPGEKVARALPLGSRISLINAYTLRLIQAARYDVARQALTMIRDTTKEPAIKGLVAGRLAQLDLIGKPAPPIVGTSVDGQAVDLAASKGDVVLVVFWASWCLPNAQEASRFGELASAYRDKGFRVIGINLDALQDGGTPVETVMPNVRRFLLDHNVRWPNLVNGPGAKDYAKAYGVTEIPSNALIGRDGTILHLDLNRTNLEEVLAKVLAR